MANSVASNETMQFALQAPTIHTLSRNIHRQARTRHAARLCIISACARLILLGSPLKSPADNQASRQPSAVEMRRARARQLISCNLSKWPLAFYMCTRPPVAPCSVVKPFSS